MIAKKRLAAEIVRLYHGEEEAQKAKKEFEEVFAKGGRPEKAPVWKLAGKKINLPELLFKKKITKSKSEARRLLKQGGVSLSGRKLRETEEVLEEGTLRIGKKDFIEIKKG